MNKTSAPSKDLSALISRQPGVKNGISIIAGTGVTVKRIAGWSKLGMDAEEIARTVGHITVDQVDAALAYYHSNLAEIDHLLEEEKSEHDRLSKEFPGAIPRTRARFTSTKTVPIRG
jgi:uncharacterized protein (DUF433 family)